MALWDFIETHDLSRALAGANTRPVLIWRQGLLGHLLTEQTHYVTHWRRILSTVESIGDAIAHRLLRAPDDQRSRAARMNWQMRDAVSSGTLLATARGQDATIDALTFPTIWRDSDIGEIEYSPILAAARMTSRLPATVAGRVLRLINALPGRETSIPAVSDAVIAAANLDRSAPPYAQAYEYAKVFRVTLGLDENSPFLPEQWLDHMGVLVQDERLGEKTIDAVAAWGPQNGPAIIINRDGWFSSSPNGRNTSLAHEICHLLIDRQDALPAAEVMGGRVDVAVEQRARAFAAEVMLPRAVAGASLRQAADESGAVRAVRSLSNRFGVSHEIVARQAYNSQVALKPTVFERLRQMVSDPSRFNP
ncbi:ImmA/IrrE family metallo-endopeptidase [Nocardioides zeae]|uniref:ImmA/IrrE family metallo-endopeptidase n=1 Tax=Nocardioides zeae TaxID=1457234 RepID=A0A6P0HEJ2_9ACTN|nr:ImmA/IrrE family metallo-endopeptidase [Nocardioides zeae]NEN77162.1 ImmA/IrrE family metallo-endopeptidase [Nocardioides zeae]